MFFKVRDHVSGSELDEDAVQHVKIIAVKPGAHPNEQINLGAVKYLCGSFAVRLTIEVIAVRNFEATAMTATYSLDGVGTHEQFKVAVDCPLRHMKFTSQIFTSVVPSKTQGFYQTLAAFNRAHAFAPFLSLPVADSNG